MHGVYATVMCNGNISDVIHIHLLCGVGGAMLHAMHMYLFSVVLYSRLFCVWLCGGNGWVVLYVVHISILCGKMGIVT